MRVYCFYIVKWTDELHTQRNLYVIWVKTNNQTKPECLKYTMPAKGQSEKSYAGWPWGGGGSEGGTQEGECYHTYYYVLVKYGTGCFTVYWLWVREMFFERKLNNPGVICKGQPCKVYRCQLNRKEWDALLLLYLLGVLPPRQKVLTF